MREELRRAMTFRRNTEPKPQHQRCHQRKSYQKSQDDDPRPRPGFCCLVMLQGITLQNQNPLRMAALLTVPENTELFHRIRKGPLFPQVLLTLDSESGVKTGWARCCGFNLSLGRLYCLPLHSSFSLESVSEPGTVVLACPQAELSLHLSGQFSTLKDPGLAPHFWKRLQPIVEALSLTPDQLLDFEVNGLKRDRFFHD